MGNLLTPINLSMALDSAENQSTQRRPQNNAERTNKLHTNGATVETKMLVPEALGNNANQCTTVPLHHSLPKLQKLYLSLQYLPQLQGGSTQQYIMVTLQQGLTAYSHSTRPIRNHSTPPQ